jgi:hypothetical protein
VVSGVSTQPTISVDVIAEIEAEGQPGAGRMVYVHPG